MKTEQKEQKPPRTPTPGPWAISKSGATSPKASYVYSTGKATGCICFIYPEHEDAEANAHLIAEAGTVANETGLTPRQLAEQNKELLEILREGADIISGLEAACYNGGIGYLVEGRDWWRQADAAIAKAEGKEGN